MLDVERTALKDNAGELANLLTENVPYLLSHYMSKDVLTESEREAIISAGSPQEIRLKLVETLAEKEGISLEEVIEGLNATDNHSVSKEINSLLGKKPVEDEVNNGSGDKMEDVSTVAANLVDDVIAKAEDKTNSSVVQDNEKDAEELDDSQEIKDSDLTTGTTVVSNVESSPSAGSDSQNPEKEDETGETSEKLVEASVEVHMSAEEDVQTTSEDVQDGQEEIEEVPERNVTFHETVATIIEDDHHRQEEEKVDEEEQQSASVNGATEFESKSQEVDAQNESENEDVDNIDIEKEFVMPSEAEHNNNFDAIQQSKVSNGGRIMTRMDSNDIILDGEDKSTVTNGNKPSTGDEGLDSILARKALVKSQVQMFEKSSPGQGTVKYSFKSSSNQEQPVEEVKTEGSNVKNLKNFFQRLSTSSVDSSSSPSGAAKPVGKLKVTFPAS